MKSTSRLSHIATKVLWCAPALSLTHAARAQESAPQSTLPRAPKVPLSQRLQEFRGERAPIEAFPLRNRARQYPSLKPAATFLPAVTHESLVGETTTFANTWRFRSERHADERASRWSRGERVAEAWKLGVDAPVEHPWGTLKISADFEGAGGGLASDANAATAGDKRGGAVAVQQDVQLGSISGSTKIAVSQTENRDSSAPLLTNAPGAQNQAAEGSANLRWQMTPGLALTTSHQSRVDVLRGDMSLVGPRPPLPKEVAELEPWQRRKLSVKGGLTCLWQASGRNEITNVDEWMRLDLEYIDNWSLWLDVKLLFKTLKVLVTSKGAS
jgi:hypothetical protein